jgi:hypothetical protein
VLSIVLLNDVAGSSDELEADELEALLLPASENLANLNACKTRENE